ncbi:SDR family oxidoreductase [Amycolatopsis rhabdoformis]|uniref:SDR family oxidoreductase n=1 Tax=Amycolatopsis rhabdoformis TaxID=1448059 RepID=A0ABZ1I7E3_9PSEU|nr:SDR family oxidoreductase [Amycolatopsis rhabdoformis]WSE29886.1 SDR family oxidoreductase [Amycolatopsis rhabdoformis]
MTDNNVLQGRVALVTGGSRGVGRGVVLRLAREGADVAFSYVNSKDKAEALVGELTALGVRAQAFRADAGNADEAAALVEDTVAEFGRLDILVHNAAVFVTGSLGAPDRDEAAHRRQFAVNTHAVVAGTRAAAAHLGEGGRVILISSTGAVSSGGSADYGDYAATKAAIEAYARSWTHEFGPRGVTVNVLQLGAIATDMLNRDPAEFAESVPVRRVGTPADVAAAVAFLAGPEAGYVSGATLRMDGGSHA